MRGLTGWTTALDWKLARSSLAAGKELVMGSKIPLDLLQLKSGHLENLDYTRLFSAVHIRPSCKTLDVKSAATRVRALPLYHTTEINITDYTRQQTSERIMEGD